MIYGIGIDIIEINRIKEIVIRSGDKLAKRILRDSELKVYYSKECPVHFLSKRFVAKEAALKAFGTGVSQGITFSQFEIFNDTLGKPMLRLFSKAALLAKKLELVRIHVSMSDTCLYACAVVILEY